MRFFNSSAVNTIMNSMPNMATISVTRPPTQHLTVSVCRLQLSSENSAQTKSQKATLMTVTMSRPTQHAHWLIVSNVKSGQWIVNLPLTVDWDRAQWLASKSSAVIVPLLTEWHCPCVSSSRKTSSTVTGLDVSTNRHRSICDRHE